MMHASRFIPAHNPVESACSGKTAYATWRDAHKATKKAARIQTANSRRRHAYEVYHCPYGRHWHIVDKSTQDRKRK